ncbi:MAG TPA: hypothetical protein PKZ53_06385, partial [Acidobacteriota bacterium]|nr:hypothetical protein [Acidobacteriota bacterium]
CSPVLVPDETKIKGQKGHQGQGESRFGGRDTETLVNFQATKLSKIPWCQPDPELASTDV